MVDKIKPLKFETDSTGTQIDYIPTESKPSEDYLACKGVSFENSDSELVYGDSGVIKFKDSSETTAISVTQLKTAKNNTFDNTSNGFSASDVQMAIEEAKATAAGLPRFTISLVWNGTVSNGDWVSYDNLTPDSRIILPVKCRLNELAYSNANTDRSFDLGLYKNGRPGTLLDTLEVRNSQNGYFTSLNQDFNIGDYLDIKYVDKGNNASDLVLVLFIQVLE
jgi:hypothetical protein